MYEDATSFHIHDEYQTYLAITTSLNFLCFCALECCQVSQSVWDVASITFLRDLEFLEIDFPKSISVRHSVGETGDGTLSDWQYL